MKLSYKVGLVIVTGIVLLFAIAQVQAVVSIKSEMETINKPEVDKTYKVDKRSCELEANKEYASKIKLFGTPVFIDGKEYDSLSKEQWEQLNNDRLIAIEECYEPSSANI